MKLLRTIILGLYVCACGFASDKPAIQYVYLLVEPPRQVSLDGKKTSIENLVADLKMINFSDQRVLCLKMNSEVSYETGVAIIEQIKKAGIQNVTFTSDDEQ